MAVTIQEVRTRGQRQAFLELPFSLHRGDPIWTPPLLDDLTRSLSDKNPLWRDGRGERQLLLATDGGRPVGRVLAHVHHASNAAHGERAGFFGLLECPDDLEVARALLDAAAERHRGAPALGSVRSGGHALAGGRPLHPLPGPGHRGGRRPGGGDAPGVVEGGGEGGGGCGGAGALLRGALLRGGPGRRGRARRAVAARLAGGDAAPPGDPPDLGAFGPARLGADEVAPGLASATGARVPAGEVRPAAASSPSPRASSRANRLVAGASRRRRPARPGARSPPGTTAPEARAGWEPAPPGAR